eukprot:g4406.t1
MASTSSSAADEKTAPPAESRYGRLHRVVDQALETIAVSCNRHVFRDAMKAVPLPALAPERVGDKRKRAGATVGHARREIIDEIAHQLIQKVTARVKDEFWATSDTIKLRESLAALDQLLKEQPQIGENGERAPAPLRNSPDDLLRKQRVRVKLKDKEALEELLVGEKERHAKVKAELEKQRAVAAEKETVLAQRLEDIEKAYQLAVEQKKAK